MGHQIATTSSDGSDDEGEPEHIWIIRVKWY